MRLLFWLGVLFISACATTNPDFSYVPLAAAAKNYQESPDDVPEIRVPPKFPGYAQRMGIQGYVCFIFDINQTGSVENLRVYDSKPQGIFEENAVDAFKKWKFRPSGAVRVDRQFCFEFLLSY